MGFTTLEFQMEIHSLEIIRARQLRKNPTKAESALWSELRARQLSGYRFRRQHPMGRFIVDFVCLEGHLVVELDGGQHAASVEYDAARTACLHERGFSVIRFWNNQVLAEMNGVRESILLALTR